MRAERTQQPEGDLRPCGSRLGVVCEPWNLGAVAPGVNSEKVKKSSLATTTPGSEGGMDHPDGARRTRVRATGAGRSTGSAERPGVPAVPPPDVIAADRAAVGCGYANDRRGTS